MKFKIFFSWISILNEEGWVNEFLTLEKSLELLNEERFHNQLCELDFKFEKLWKKLTKENYQRWTLSPKLIDWNSNIYSMNIPERASSNFFKNYWNWSQSKEKNGRNGSRLVKEKKLLKCLRH